eukprot:Nk52_evm55s359 gene=Nk52_evmTU55s359
MPAQYANFFGSYAYAQLQEIVEENLKFTLLDSWSISNPRQEIDIEHVKCKFIAQIKKYWAEVIPKLEYAKEEDCRDELISMIVKVLNIHGDHIVLSGLIMDLLFDIARENIVPLGVVVRGIVLNMSIEFENLWLLTCEHLKRHVHECDHKECTYVLRVIVSNCQKAQKDITPTKLKCVHVGKELLTQLLDSERYLLPHYMALAEIKRLFPENAKGCFWSLDSLILPFVERFRNLASVLSVANSSRLFGIVDARLPPPYRLDNLGCLILHPSHQIIPHEPNIYTPQYEILQNVLSQMSGVRGVRDLLTQSQAISKKHTALQHMMVEKTIYLLKCFGSDVDEELAKRKECSKNGENSTGKGKEEKSKSEEAEPDAAEMMNIDLQMEDVFGEHGLKGKSPSEHGDKNPVLEESADDALDGYFYLVADQFFSLVCVEAIDFGKALIEFGKLYTRARGPTKKRILSGNRLLWLMAQCAPLDSVKLAFKGSYKDFRGSLFDVLFLLYEDSISNVDINSDDHAGFIRSMALACLLSRLSSSFRLEIQNLSRRFPRSSHPNLSRATNLLDELTGRWYQDYKEDVLTREYIVIEEFKKLVIIALVSSQSVISTLFRFLESKSPEGTAIPIKMYKGRFLEGRLRPFSMQYIDFLPLYCRFRFTHRFNEEIENYVQTRLTNNPSVLINLSLAEKTFAPGLVETYVRFVYSLRCSIDACDISFGKETPVITILRSVFQKQTNTQIGGTATESGAFCEEETNQSTLLIANALVEMISFRLIGHIKYLNSFPEFLNVLITSLPKIRNRQLYASVYNCAVNLMLGLTDTSVLYSTTSGTASALQKGVGESVDGTSILSGLNVPDIFDSIDKDSGTFRESELLNRTLILSVAKVVKISNFRSSKSNFKDSEVYKFFNDMYSAHPCTWHEKTMKYFPLALVEFYKQAPPPEEKIRVTQEMVMNELGSGADNVNNMLIVQKDGEETSSVTDLLEYYSVPEKQPLFLCIVWTILFQTKKSSAKFCLSFRCLKQVLLQFSPHSLSSSYIHTFTDYVLLQLGSEPSAKQMTQSGNILSDLIWKYQVFPCHEVILSLCRGDVKDMYISTAFRLIGQLLVESNELSMRINTYLNILNEQSERGKEAPSTKGFPHLWELDDYFEKLNLYLKEYPEWFNFENCSGISGVNTESEENDRRLPIYYGPVILKVLNCLDFLMCRCLEFEEKSLLKSILAKYRNIYFYHSQPVKFVHETLVYYEESPALTADVRKLFAKLVDFPNSGLSAKFVEYLNNEDGSDASWIKRSYFEDVIDNVSYLIHDVRGYEVPARYERSHNHLRFDEFPNTKERGIYMACIEMMALPVSKEEVCNNILNLVLQPSPFKSHKDMLLGKKFVKNELKVLSHLSKSDARNMSNATRNINRSTLVNTNGLIIKHLPESYKLMLYGVVCQTILESTLLTGVPTQFAKKTKYDSGCDESCEHFRNDAASGVNRLAEKIVPVEGFKASKFVKPNVKRRFECYPYCASFIEMDFDRANRLSCNNSPNTVCALLHAFWRHSAKAELTDSLSLVRSLLRVSVHVKRKGGFKLRDAEYINKLANHPGLTSEVQVLYVCRLIGPFIEKLDNDANTLGDLVTHVCLLLQEVCDYLTLVSSDKGFSPNNRTLEQIVDFLYHIKYRFKMHDKVYEDIDGIINNMCEPLKSHLRFIPRQSKPSSSST